jgi:hypothetical protein
VEIKSMPGPKRPPAVLQANGFALYGSSIVWIASIKENEAFILKTKAIGKNAETGRVVSYGKLIPVSISELTAI